ncbi:hypothetical protein [Paenimyroides ceti]
MKKRKDYINFLYLIVIFNLLSISCGAQRSEEFRIYDAMLIKQKPSLYKEGLSFINMIYDDSLLVYKDLSDLNASNLSNEKFLRSSKRVKPSYPICLDIEVWLFNEEHIHESVRKYTDVLQKFKKKFPKTDIGLYGVIPYADLNIYQEKATFLNDKSKDWMQEWKYINSNLGSIVSNSNIAFPSCYTRFKDRDLWKFAFLEQIKKIKEIDSNIKIYAFLWPQYYAAGFEYNDHLVEADFWKLQLEMAYKYCDGVVVWAPHYNSNDRSDYTWNENAEWWQTTKQFIKDKNIKSNYANKR